MAAAAGLELGGFGLEHVDKQSADDLALCSGSLTPASLPRNSSLASTRMNFGVQLAFEHVHDHVAFVQAQQAVVHEHAGQLVANGAVNQRAAPPMNRHHRTGPRMTSSSPTCSADGLHGFGDVVGMIQSGWHRRFPSTKRSK